MAALPDIFETKPNWGRVGRDGRLCSLVQNPPEVHKDAQPQPASAPQTYRRETSKVGRNEACRCPTADRLNNQQK